jgi:hypothetical protein
MKKVPKDKESGLPKKYVAGVSTSTAKARAAHWAKTKEMDPKNPAAYTPAPGDKNAKTKESKHTKAYRAKFGEEAEMEKDYIDEEAASGLAKKAKESGVSIGTLRKVYNRGMAAWRTGHRPGTTPQQWAMARVNSYITKGKGTYHGADKDLREEEIDEACWKGYKQVGMKKKGGRSVPNCVPEQTEPHSTDKNKPSSRFDASDELVSIYKKDTPGQSSTLKAVKKVVREALGDCGCGGNCKCGDTKKVNEAEYQGRKVQLGKPMAGDVKKSKVYVRNEKGNVVKVNFGDKNMKIKKHIPGRRKNFRARHNCDNPGPRTKARYWSCRAW